jgi:hypothetical protein
MKTTKTILAMVLAGLLGTTAMASGNLRVNIAPGNNEMADVAISNVKMSTFKIDVTDEYGEIIFSKETKSPANNYKRSYDFSRLEDGTYFFTVKVDNESTETKFDIENGEMKIIEEKKRIDPVFIMDNKQLKLSYLNFGQENTNLYVYDRNRNLVYEKDLKSGFVTQHGVDFSKAPRGNYEVVLSSGNDVHSYDVFID